MITLRFEGHSDDTFGEVAHFKDDYDNCASGDPITYLVKLPAERGGVLVTGQYCRPGFDVCWQISVASYDPLHDDLPLPDWPMRIERGDRHYSPALVIEAPDGVTISCIERRGA